MREYKTEIALIQRLMEEKKKKNFREFGIH